MIFHSDQGSIYGSKVFCKTAQDYGLIQSMSRRGNCWDNAPMERWFRSFKYEWMQEGGYLRASDGRYERLCDVLQFCSPTSLQSRFATCFNKNNLSGTVELVDHYK